MVRTVLVAAAIVVGCSSCAGLRLPGLPGSGPPKPFAGQSTDLGLSDDDRALGHFLKGKVALQRGDQARAIQGAGGLPILLPLVALPARGLDADAYVAHYAAVIDALEGPLFVHWLGQMFHPGLAGYFPDDSFARVMAHAPDKVRGCKLSLLDAALERRVRAELAPRGQVVLTGDDHNFADLIVEGGDTPTDTADLAGRPLALGPFSHALLGVLDGVAAPAGLALRALAAGDAERARALLGPCEAYGRHVFGAPTKHYKVGLAFTSYLAGRQDNWMLPLHLERARDRAHLLRTADLAAAAGAFEDLDLARARLEAFRAD